MYFCGSDAAGVVRFFSEVLFVYPRSVLFPPQPGMHLAELLPAASTRDIVNNHVSAAILYNPIPVKA
jgi:hypothetical protein